MSEMWKSKRFRNLERLSHPDDNDAPAKIRVQLQYCRFLSQMTNIDPNDALPKWAFECVYNSGISTFDNIRQMVRLIEKYSGFQCTF
jgi:hypothetical protein